MRLIDADALAAYFEKKKVERMPDGKLRYSGVTIRALDMFLEFVAIAPTIKAEPVKHGKWIQPDKEHEFNDLYRCSKCYYLGDWHDIGKKYCPNCGAKMDL